MSDMSREDLATWAALADDREGRAILALLADVERLTEERDALAARDARVRELLAARPNGEDVVRVTIRLMPSVGISRIVTRTYVSQHALRRAFDGDA